jgi:two-component system, OmpR family, sensor histidine kinase MprB
VTFRARLIVAAAVAVAMAIALTSAVVYAAVRSELRDPIDHQLRKRLYQVSQAPLGLACARPGETPILRFPGATLGGPEGYVQVICPGEATYRPSGEEIALPVSDRARKVAAGEEDAFFSDATVSGTHVRMLTAPHDDFVAVQIARPLDEVDSVLRRLQLVLAGVSLGGIALAALLGLLVARTALAPVRRLTAAAELVTATTDLSQRVEAQGSDELSRLGATFNQMLGALDDSQRAQRQLVADASHELRTPLTSLRTNVEVLAKEDSLPPEERERLRRDVLQQAEELTALVGDVVDLAIGDGLPSDPEDVQLDVLAAEAVERAGRHSPGVTFRSELRPVVVRGVPRRLERALVNLLDNAAKWSPPGAEIDVTLERGTFTVRDRGPGFDPTDQPYVFDRFYRSPKARGLPGSGLGLAIVRQVAEEHGGSVEASNHPDGGGLVRLTLPATDP